MLFDENDFDIMNSKPVRGKISFLILVVILIVPLSLFSQKDSIEYKIQIATSRTKPLSINYLKRKYNIRYPIAQEYNNGYFKYVLGSFAHYNDAERERIILMKQHRVVGAFVVAYLNNTRVTYKDILDYFKRNETKLDIIGGIKPEKQESVEHKEGGSEKYDIRNRTIKFLLKNLPSPINNWLIEFVKISYGSLQLFLLLFAILFLLANISFVIFIVIFRNYARHKKGEKSSRIQAQYQDWLTRFIFDKEEEYKIFRNLQSIRSKRRKQILIDEILNIYANLKGDTAIKLKDLYLQLKLDKVSIRNIDNRSWIKKIRAFHEITQMDLKEAQRKIEKYVNSSNDTVRIEAQIAMVRLNEKDPFSFLDNLREIFTQWEQMNVHALIKLYGINLPSFSRWFESINDTVIVFAVRMANTFQQTDDYQKILDLVTHNNEKVRYYAIKAIGALGISDGIDELIKGYEEETYNNKIEILKVLQNVPDETEIEFLIHRTYEEDFNIQIEALSALYNIGRKGQNIIIGMENERDEEFKQKVKHIFDRRI